VLSLGLDEALETTAGVFIIEWPEKMQDWLEKTHAKKREVTIEIKEGDQREVTIRTE
jgi:tRNA A37 threonylcarbamoyladenosine biosynthesis protein TsaE